MYNTKVLSYSENNRVRNYFKEQNRFSSFQEYKQKNCYNFEI